MNILLLLLLFLIRVLLVLVLFFLLPPSSPIPSLEGEKSSGRTSGKGHKKKKKTKKPRSTATSCSNGTLLEKKESPDSSAETKPSAHVAEVDGKSVESRPEPDGVGQEMAGPSNGSKTGDGSAGGAVETPCGNATARADGGAGVSDKTKVRNVQDQLRYKLCCPPFKILAQKLFFFFLTFFLHFIALLPEIVSKAILYRFHSGVYT